MSDEKQSTGGNFRWVICALLFFATTINYVDRAVLGVLEPELEKIIKWSAQDWGYINAAFTLAYAIGFLFVGWFMDRVGTRWGYAIALIVWSIAAASHAFASSVTGFIIARFALGIGEAGNFPAAIKTTAEWFPRSERAFATGIFNAGSNVGAILAPLVVPILFAWHGWQTAFVVTGLLGIIWVFFWLPIYRHPQDHPKLSRDELAYIESDPADPPIKIRWRDLLPFRQTWAFALGKFLTDPIWWFYLFWFAKFMSDKFGIGIKTISLPMITVYLLADVGSVLGGWQSSFLLKQGWSVSLARKTAMLICALCVIPVAFAPHASNVWLAVILIGIAASAHQGFSANLFTLTSDMFPRRVVGSVVGIGGFAGAIGGALFQILAGWLFERFGNYNVIFLIAACAYLVALLVIHLLVPRLTPATLPTGNTAEPGARPLVE